MKFYSEILDKLFDSEKELDAAEDKHTHKETERDKLKAELKQAQVAAEEKRAEYRAALDKVSEIRDALSETYYTYFVDGEKVSRKEYLEAIEKINKL